MDYALLVGINKYASAPLSGCVNDVLDMADLLVSVYGFLPQNIRMLVDERATTAAIKERLEWLVSGLKAGDRLVFHFSGHGTQVVTRNKKQELDGLDECICLTGDTLIPLLDGTEKTLADIVLSGAPVDVYSVDASGRIRAGKGISPRCTARSVPVLQVTLDNGCSVRCTPDHLWLLRDGTYKKAAELLPGTSLMPLYRTKHKYANNLLYEETLNPASGKYEGTHRLIAGDCPADVAARAKEQECGAVRHHINCNSLDNRPENLVWVTWHEHELLHHGTPEAREQASRRSKERWADPVYRERTVAAISIGASIREADPRIKSIRSKAAKKQDLTAFHAAAGRASQQRLLDAWQTPEYRAFMQTRQAALKPGTSSAMKDRWADTEYRARMRTAQKEAAARRPRDATGRLLSNHKVVSVKSAGLADVYDLTVPEFENFALSAGVFVHNCPFDFDWTDERMIRDKDFAKLFARIPPSVNFVWLSDSCHSGDLQRDLAPPLREGRVLGVRHYPKPVDIAWREKGAQSLGLDFLYPFKTYKDRGPLLLSGCKSDQTSADASFTGRANGAFTYYLIKELKAAAEAESPVELPLSQLVARIQQSMKHAGFRQEPQLVGPPARTSRPFLK